MYKEIALKDSEGNITKQPFLTTATTSIRYRGVFHREIMADMVKLVKFADKDPEELIENGVLDIIKQLSYIMNMHGLKADMTTLNFESYMEWLDNHDEMNLLEHMGDIIELYMGNKATTSIAKKNQSQRKEK